MGSKNITQIGYILDTCMYCSYLNAIEYDNQNHKSCGPTYYQYDYVFIIISWNLLCELKSTKSTEKRKKKRTFVVVK